MSANISKSKRKKTQEGKEINLTIEAKDFGPITDGKIIFKPLTIFIGPNNSGKSYAAMLVHSLFESYAQGIPAHILERFSEPFDSLFLRYFDFRNLLEQFTELRDQVVNMKEGEELEIPLKRIADKIFEDIFEKKLNDEIVRSYACPLKELIRVREKSFELRITYNSFDINLVFQENKLRIKNYPKLNLKARIQYVGRSGREFKISRNEEGILFNMAWRKGEKEREIMFVDAMEIVSNYCLSEIFKGMAMPCYYLPAARSGILQGHKALAASIVRKAPFVGIERLEIPKFSGVVSDFISSIITLPERDGPFYKLAQRFERELIKGEIVVKTLDEYLYPEIRYSFQEIEIPLHRSSSTVSELAPLVLYLKYVIGPGSILIIEEPEAHLHPKNQRILAKFLVKLRRRGVNIIITTHSDLLLEQLSDFILLGRIEPGKRASKYGYEKEDFLSPSEVALYIFSYDENSGGNRVTEVEVTEEDGIPQEEHMRIIEALYEETMKLRRDLSAEK